MNASTSAVPTQHACLDPVNAPPQRVTVHPNILDRRIR